MRHVCRSWLILAFGTILGVIWSALPGPPALAQAQGSGVQASGAQGSAVQGAAALGSSEEIQMGISADVIPVTSDFGGTNLVVFGAIENPNRVAQALDRYSLVVVIRGAPKTVVVWRKQRVFGIWVNRQSRTYADVPSFYEVAASRPLEELASPDVLKANGIGVAYIPLNLFIQRRIGGDRAGAAIRRGDPRSAFALGPLFPARRQCRLPRFEPVSGDNCAARQYSNRDP